jgi:hypothetical protein
MSQNKKRTSRGNGSANLILPSGPAITPADFAPILDAQKRASGRHEQDRGLFSGSGLNGSADSLFNNLALRRNPSRRK